jgi:hypothetical protein
MHRIWLGARLEAGRAEVAGPKSAILDSCAPRGREELEAATTRAAMNAAGKKLMQARAKLKRLQTKAVAVEA